VSYLPGCMPDSDVHSAADAASHLFFAYLRSLSPDPARGTKGIIGLPISLQQLVQATEYPPQAPTLMFNEATKVVMIVETVSATPYALLRRAKNFEYRDDDSALQQFANYDDPVRALTDECRRVLKCISSTNQSTVSTTKASTSLRDASWSRFEDVGFGATVEESDGEEDGDSSMLGPIRHHSGLRRQALSQNGDLGRPTTPSWADFLSTGFTDENGKRVASSMLLPPDKVLPPIHTTQRGQSSQSHRRNLETESTLEHGELASIEKIDLDDAFWWVWISSLAGEEPTSRKAVFGRCALIETILPGGKWMIMEEQVKGAAPEPAPGAYIAEKKGFLGFTTRRGRLTKKKAALKKSTLSKDPYSNTDGLGPMSRMNITPDQHARIQTAARELHRRNAEQERLTNGARRGRQEETSDKTHSVMTLQPMLMTEATQAMKWASQYDKKDIRAKYLGDDLAGRGSTSDLLSPSPVNGLGANPSSVSLAEPARADELPTPPEKVPLPQSPAPVPQGIPLAKFPTPSPPKEIPLPKEVPLPKTPSPPPTKASPPPLPPSPPPSNIVNQKPVPAPAMEPAETPTAASRNDAFTALPEPPSPVATHQHPSEPQAAATRKAVPSSLEGKLVKKRQVGAGIKGIFGSRRVKDPSFTPPVSPPVENGPAVAAARAALAGNKPQPNGQPIHEINTQANREKPSAAQIRSQRPLTPPLEPAYEVPDTPPAPVSIPRAAAIQRPDGAPRTRHDSEDGGLSRVSTNEREQADREFSTFDQGPLLEQPAFISPESPVRTEQTKSLEAEPSQQVPGEFISEVPKEEVDESRDLTREISPVQDRWAQIRKNAADRAARLSEEQRRPSEAKTDDGETSGEESESCSLPTP
jgi:Domain of unknown function (DUF1708)